MHAYLNPVIFLIAFENKSTSDILYIQYIKIIADSRKTVNKLNEKKNQI